ncbi:hypothetical protein ACJX0J_036600, partial [Zea mays]
MLSHIHNIWNGLDYITQTCMYMGLLPILEMFFSSCLSDALIDINMVIYSFVIILEDYYFHMFSSHYAINWIQDVLTLLDIIAIKWIWTWIENSEGFIAPKLLKESLSDYW